MKNQIFENANLKALAIAKEKKKGNPTIQLETLEDEERLKEYRKQLRYVCYGGLANQILEVVPERLKQYLISVSDYNDSVTYCCECDKDKQLAETLKTNDIPAVKGTCNEHRRKYTTLFIYNNEL